MSDGNCAFLNLFDNRVHGTGDESRAGDLTLDFATPVSRVGFSLHQFGRQGYFTMTGAGIRSFKIVTEPGDIFVIDHLVFTPSPVPEPATLGALASGAIVLTRRRKANRVR